MLLQERQRFLTRGLPLEQRADRAQAVGAVGPGHVAGAFDGVGGMAVGQVEQPLQHADPFHAPRLQHGLGPAQTARTQATDLAQQPGRAPLHAADLGAGDVRRLRAEATRFVPDMQGDLLQALVEDPHQAPVPAGPHLPAQVLRRHRVVGPLDLDMAVAVHHPPRLVEVGEVLGRQGQQSGPLDFGEVGADLAAGGAVQARVSHRLLPVQQEAILLLQAVEGPPLQGVLLHVVDAPFHLPLVARRVGPGRQEGRAVMGGEGTHLGIEIGVEPVGLLDRGPQVVQDQPLRHAAEVPEGVFQATQEVVGGLAADGLAVSLARVAQDDAEDMGAAALAVVGHERGAGAEIDLGLLAGAAFETAEGEFLGRLQAVHEAADAVVAAGEAVLGHQVLVDALGTETQLQLGLDEGAPGQTITGPTSAARRLRGRRRHVGKARRADGRIGWF